MSNALIKVDSETISSNDQMNKLVSKLKDQTIPLFPETVQFRDPALKYGVALVTVDLKLDKYGNNKDIYRNESGGYCLHLSKTNEVGQQFGVVYTDSKIIERKTDDRGRVVFISHQVRGKCKSVDGTVKEDVATGKYDYYRDCEKYVSKKDGKQLTNMINSRRSHAEALAESNAKSRLIGKLVTKLPSSFTIDELKKPFLIPYVIEDTNELINQLDPEDRGEMKKALISKRLGIATKIYPAGSSQPSLPEQTQRNETDPSNKNIEEANFVDKPDKNTEPDPKEQNRIIAEEFRGVEQNERTEKILNLIKIKDWKHPKGAIVTTTMINKATIDDQINRIEEMLNMPDLIEEEVGL